MPTVHYISRDTYRKHGIGHIPWELMNNAPTAGNSNSSSKKRRVTNDVTADEAVVDGAIRNNATDTAANSGIQQPPQKSIGMDDNDIDAEDQSHDGTGINLQMDNLVEGQCLNLPSEPKADGTVKHKQRKDFFDRVDELKAFKEKHGRINVREKEDLSLYNFCRKVRQSRSALLTGKGKLDYRLDDDRITALDAIGFDWYPGVSSTATSKDDKFFARVDELKAFKEKHGHLNLLKKEDLSLYGFCNNLRQSRRALLTGKGEIHNRLDDDRIAALDAIGFEWEAGASSTPASNNDIFFAQLDELKAYKEKHGHLNIRQKEDLSLYGFCNHLRQSRKGKGTYRLDETRIAALDAIGFNWDPLELEMSSTSTCSCPKCSCCNTK